MEGGRLGKREKGRREKGCLNIELLLGFLGFSMALICVFFCAVTDNKRKYFGGLKWN
jgi:hypothetical protein